MDATMQAAAFTAGVVAILCAIVAVACWRALLRTGNPRVKFVVAAFAVLGAKNLVKSLLLANGATEAPWLELAFSLTDLAAVALIAWPLVSRRGP